MKTNDGSFDYAECSKKIYVLGGKNKLKIAGNPEESEAIRQELVPWLLH